MAIVAVCWLPVIDKQQGGQLYIYLQSIATALSPPVAAVYLLAILYKRTNEQGIFYGLLVQKRTLYKRLFFCSGRRYHQHDSSHCRSPLSKAHMCSRRRQTNRRASTLHVLRAYPLHCRHFGHCWRQSHDKTCATISSE